MSSTKDTKKKAAKPAASKPGSKPSKKSSSKGKKKKGTSKDWKSQHSHLFKKEPRVFRIGRDIPPKRDLSRFVRWPRYVRLQRQKAILKKRLKVPPAIHQFSKTVSGAQAKELFRLLQHYRPETAAQKKKRLEDKAHAEAKKEGSSQAGKRPVVLKYGLNHVTTLVEQKKASLVAIAHDVDPIELVVWLPALCRKMDIPYCIVKGKARLGHLVDKKNASVVALTDVKKEHAQTLQNLVQTLRVSYNDNVAARTEWGGQQMGFKFNNRKRKQDQARAKLVVAK
jgi:large subunit ribosomal protein L7Ae